MAGIIIGCVVSFGCGILFFCIGSYAKKLPKPMWFWSGCEVKATQLTDVKAYNRENAAMWQRYSLWCFVGGIVNIFSPIGYLVILIGSCTVGLALLVRRYNRIFAKYSVK